MRSAALAGIAAVALVFGAFPQSSAADPIRFGNGAFSSTGQATSARGLGPTRAAGQLLGGLDIVPMEAFSDCASCGTKSPLGQVAPLGAPPSWKDEADGAGFDGFGDGVRGFSSGAAYGVGGWTRTAMAGRPAAAASVQMSGRSNGSSRQTVSVPIQFTGGSPSLTGNWLSIPIPTQANGQPFQGNAFLRFDLSVVPLANNAGFQLVLSNAVLDMGPTDSVPTPEPASALLLGSGLAAGLAYVRRRRRA